MTAPAPRHSLVTGGGGFVGRHLVDALRARGDEVTVVELSGAPHRDDVRWIEADIRDDAAVLAACEGVDSVFHNASLVHTKRNRQETIWGVNLDGTKNVLAASKAHGVDRLVYVSTASAVYEGKDVVDGDETLPYSRISQAPYADSKIAAEKLVLASSGEDGHPLACAIRPHVIFGPGDTRFLPAILDRARRGKLRFSVGWGEKLSDFTYVDNLLDGLLRGEAHLVPGGAAPGQAYFVTNGEPLPFFEFVKRVLAKLELPPIVGAVPFPVAYAVASVAEAIDTLKGGTLNAENGLSRFAVRYMCTHHYFSIEKARAQLGYVPAVSIDEGIDRTVAHLREQEAIAA